MPSHFLRTTVVTQAPIQERIINPANYPVQRCGRIDTAVIICFLLSLFVLFDVLGYHVQFFIDWLHSMVHSELQVIHNIFTTSKYNITDTFFYGSGTPHVIIWLGKPQLGWALTILDFVWI